MINGRTWVQKGVEKITVCEKINRKWKAIRRWWDGSTKSDGRSGCGVVKKGVDRGRWVTVSEIAVPSTKHGLAKSRSEAH